MTDFATGTPILIAFEGARPLRTWVVCPRERELGAHGPTDVDRLITTEGTLRWRHGEASFWWSDTPLDRWRKDKVTSITRGHIGTVEWEWMETKTWHYNSTPELVAGQTLWLMQEGWEVNEVEAEHYTRHLCSRRFRRVDA